MVKNRRERNDTQTDTKGLLDSMAEPKHKESARRVRVRSKVDNALGTGQREYTGGESKVVSAGQLEPGNHCGGELPMTAEAKPNGPDGNRDSRGRFVKGNKASVGHRNPDAARVQRLYNEMLKAVSPADIQAIVHKMVSMAKSGNVYAAREVLGRCLGKPEKWRDFWASRDTSDHINDAP
jgi:hypothetical protein